MDGVHLLVPPGPKDWNDRSLKSWRIQRSQMMEFPVELLSPEEGDDIGWS